MKASTAVPDYAFMEIPDECNIFSWSPTPPGTVDAKCTQVHLHLGGPRADLVFVVRFKGPGTLRRLIRGLREHFRHVWPDEEQP